MSIEMLTHAEARRRGEGGRGGSPQRRLGMRKMRQKIVAKVRPKQQIIH
jgi:hypothetical protein